MIHFNNINTCMWIGMIFIPQFHSIYCLSFHLKHEGINYLVGNFKISRIIWNTKMSVAKMRDILVYPKKWLGKWKDILWMTYKYLWRPALLIASQVQYPWTSFRPFFLLIEMYDGGVPYISPVESWIKKSCQSNPSPWNQFQVFQVPEWFNVLSSHR